MNAKKPQTFRHIRSNKWQSKVRMCSMMTKYMFIVHWTDVCRIYTSAFGFFSLVTFNFEWYFIMTIEAFASQHSNNFCKLRFSTVSFRSLTRTWTFQSASNYIFSLFNVRQRTDPKMAQTLNKRRKSTQNKPKITTTTKTTTKGKNQKNWHLLWITVLIIVFFFFWLL